MSGEPITVVSVSAPVTVVSVPAPAPTVIETTGKQGVPGPKGDDGAPGRDGAPPPTFVHPQLAPASSWVINHGMGKFPSVFVQDSTGEDVMGDVTYVNANTVQIDFSAEFGGTAYLN